jgi:type 1 glutamine amidotransferase
MRAYAAVVVLGTAILTGLAACSSNNSSNPNAPPGTGGAQIRVLMLTATAGFRHGSIDTARQVMMGLGASGGFTVTAVDDVAGVTAASLSNHDVLFFALTSGELPFTADQKAAILSFVSRGGGFLGVHSATDTLYDWPEYGALVGAYFKEHPWTREAAVIVEDMSHPTTSMLGARFSIEEEFYTFRENPRPRVHVLLRLDAASVGPPTLFELRRGLAVASAKAEESGDYPLAWTSTHGSGRVYYNALGHFSTTWTDSRFQQQLAAAVRWASGR